LPPIEGAAALSVFDSQCGTPDVGRILTRATPPCGNRRQKAFLWAQVELHAPPTGTEVDIVDHKQFGLAVPHPVCRAVPSWRPESFEIPCGSLVSKYLYRRLEASST
jgi:hypothetical protein